MDVKGCSLACLKSMVGISEWRDSMKSLNTVHGERRACSSPLAHVQGLRARLCRLHAPMSLFTRSIILGCAHFKTEFLILVSKYNIGARNYDVARVHWTADEPKVAKVHQSLEEVLHCFRQRLRFILSDENQCTIHLGLTIDTSTVED